MNLRCSLRAVYSRLQQQQQLYTSCCSSRRHFSFLFSKTAIDGGAFGVESPPTLSLKTTSANSYNKSFSTIPSAVSIGADSSSSESAASSWEKDEAEHISHSFGDVDELTSLTALKNSYSNTISESLFSNCTEDEIANAVFILEKFVSDARKKKMNDVLKERSGNVRMVFECPTNPSNVWAALRTFDSFGIQYADVIFDDKLDIKVESKSSSSRINSNRSSSNSSSSSSSSSSSPSKLDLLKAKTKEDSIQHIKEKVSRKRLMMTSMGSHKWLTLSQHTSTEDCINGLKAQGYRVYASDLHGDSKSLTDLRFNVSPINGCSHSHSNSNSSNSIIGSSSNNNSSSSNNNYNDSSDDSSSDISKDKNDSAYGGKIAILFGKEETGISDVARRMADERFFIPMKGFAESFNLSASCAITTTHLATLGLLNPKLSDRERSLVYLTWLMRSVRNSDGILRKSNASIVVGRSFAS